MAMLIFRTTFWYFKVFFDCESVSQTQSSVKNMKVELIIEFWRAMSAFVIVNPPAPCRGACAVEQNACGVLLRAAPRCLQWGMADAFAVA